MPNQHTARPIPVMDRIEKRLDKSGPLVPGFTACWVWRGTLNPNGYGMISVNNRNTRVHRIVYEATRGKIPEGLEPDHLCRVRACANPWHIELVTHKVNNQRGISLNRLKTHCAKGHPYAGSNLRVGVDSSTGRPRRECGICKIQSSRDFRARAKARAALLQAKT